MLHVLFAISVIMIPVVIAIGVDAVKTAYQCEDIRGIMLLMSVWASILLILDVCQSIIIWGKIP